MFVSKERIQTGLSEFIELEIASKATGINKFITYLAIPMMSKKAAQLVDSFSQTMYTKELFDDNGSVDIDLLYNMAKDAIRKSGQFVMYGVILDETDLDKLYNYIKNIR